MSNYDSTQVAQSPTGPDLPESWAAASQVQGGISDEVFLVGEVPPSYWEHAQLALCESGPRVVSGPGGRCGPYRGGKGGFYRKTVPATYVYRVLEARTGRLIKEFSLPGTVDGCPLEIFVSGPPIARSVRDEAVVAQLRPLVEKPAQP